MEDLTPRKKRSSAPRAKLVNIDSEEPLQKRQRCDTSLLEPETPESSIPLFDTPVYDQTDQFHAYDDFDGVVFEHDLAQGRSRKACYHFISY